jgi:hypothetical protein
MGFALRISSSWVRIWSVVSAACEEFIAKAVRTAHTKSANLKNFIPRIWPPFDTLNFVFNPQFLFLIGNGSQRAIWTTPQFEKHFEIPFNSIGLSYTLIKKARVKGCYSHPNGAHQTGDVKYLRPAAEIPSIQTS